MRVRRAGVKDIVHLLQIIVYAPYILWRRRSNAYHRMSLPRLSL